MGLEGRELNVKRSKIQGPFYTAKNEEKSRAVEVGISDIY